jgi:hypothetical protein
MSKGFFEYFFFIPSVRLSTDRMGPLGLPPASLALLKSRTSSHMRSYPALFELQCMYESIRVWSYKTFIVLEAVVNRKLLVETLRVKTKINNNHDRHKIQSSVLYNHP